MNSSYLSMGANIPLPPGSPPPQTDPQQSQQNQHQQQISTPVFGNTSNPLTFAAFARPRENVIESTLHQYGPGPIMMTQQQQTYYSQQQQQQQQQSFQQQQFHQQQIRVGIPRMVYQLGQQYQQPVVRHQNVQNIITRPPVYPKNSLPMHCQPTTSLPTYHISPTASSTSAPAINRNASPVRAQPAVPISPPLDAIRGSSHTNIIVISTPAQEQSDDLLTQVKASWDKWTQNQMIQEYNKLGQLLTEAQKSRADLEKEVNDIVRKNPGHNVELNPVFLRKKKELSAIGLKCEDINRAMKFVGEKSLLKYNRKLENPNARQPLQNAQPQPVKKVQRARMSTAAPSPNVSKSDPADKKDALFDLKDDPLYCQPCDTLFHSLSEFCSHLHKREHTVNTETTSRHPWRRDESAKRQLDRFETYTRYRSLCDTVRDVTDAEFSLNHLDAVLHPSIKDKDELKRLRLKRDRKQFDHNDRLFSYKGYDELVPISGFYCKLCDRTLCDVKEVESHLKSWKHNMAYGQSVALQATHERDFRIKMDRALKSLSTSEKAQTSANKPKEVQSAPSKPKEIQPASSKPKEFPTKTFTAHDSTPGSAISPWSARLPYKKPTSKIVDEHDIIADKFEKRKDKESEGAKKSDSSAQSKSDLPAPPKSDSLKPSASSQFKSRSPKKQRDRPLPEILPITVNQTSASLKQLKHPYTEKPKKQAEPELDDEFPKRTKRAPQIVIDSSTEDEVGSPAKKRDNINGSVPDAPELQVVHMPKGDPDSPFPDLDISIKGNIPTSVLNDERLSKNAVVKMNRINLEDYKHMLLDSSSLWARVSGLMTKKEPGEFQKNLDTVTETAPCYFGRDGETVPVSVERDSSDEGDNVDFSMEKLQTFFCN